MEFFKKYENFVFVLALLIGFTFIVVGGTSQEGCQVSQGKTGKMDFNLMHDVSVIDNFATIQTAKDGKWSDPCTWNLGKTPKKGDVVLINENHSVLYDEIESTEIKSLVIQGKLNFDREKHTRLSSGFILVTKEGSFLIGEKSNPLPPEVSAEIFFPDVAIDEEKDPFQYGTGLIVFGNFHVFGAPKEKTFVRLFEGSKAGEKFLNLSTDIFDWEVGDRLVLPDTEQKSFEEGEVSLKIETPIIKHIDHDDLRLELLEPLQYDHLGVLYYKDRFEKALFQPHIGNLTRNIKFYSDKNAKIRGHVMFAHRADIKVHYASFNNLGRTRSDLDLGVILDERTNSFGDLMTNQIARYPVHFHHVMGPENSREKYQFELVGNVVENSPKACYTIHQSHFGLIKDNICFDARGVGFYFEDGPEKENLVENNFVVSVSSFKNRQEGLRKNEMNPGTDGSGFYFRGPLNKVRNNVVANAAHSYGYSFYLEGVGDWMTSRERGMPFDENVSLNQEEINEFFGNEVYGSRHGLGLWHINAAPDSFLCEEDDSGNCVDQSVIEKFSSWNIYETHIKNHPTSFVSFKDISIRGDQSMLLNNETTGIDYQKYFTYQGKIINADIQGVSKGVILPQVMNNLNSPESGKFLIEESDIKAVDGLVLYPIMSDSGASDLPGRLIEIKNTKFRPLYTSNENPLAISSVYDFDTGGINLVAPTTVKFINSSFPGFPGMRSVKHSFEFFSQEQAHGFVVPITGSNVKGRPSVGVPEGCNSFGKITFCNNFQAMSQHGVAVSGKIAPCSWQVLKDWKNPGLGRVCGVNNRISNGFIAY